MTKGLKIGKGMIWEITEKWFVRENEEDPVWYEFNILHKYISRHDSIPNIVKEIHAFQTSFVLFLAYLKIRFNLVPVFLFAKSDDDKLESKANETILCRSLEITQEIFLVGWFWKEFWLKSEIIKFL